MRSFARLLTVVALLSPTFAHAAAKILFNGRLHRVDTIKRNVNKALKRAMFSPDVAQTAPDSKIQLLPAKEGKIEWKVVGQFRYERGTVVPGKGVKGVEIDQSTIGLELPGR
jgi:hypothetical protein